MLRVGQEGRLVGNVLWKRCYGTSLTALGGQGTPRFPPSGLAGGRGSCSQLPFELALFLETDFKLLNMYH